MEYDVSHSLDASMISFARRTISGLKIVILGALWESYSWNMRCHVVFSGTGESAGKAPETVQKNTQGALEIVQPCKQKHRRRW